jgi:hypothetical protein
MEVRWRSDGGMLDTCWIPVGYLSRKVGGRGRSGRRSPIQLHRFAAPPMLRYLRAFVYACICGVGSPHQVPPRAAHLGDGL